MKKLLTISMLLSTLFVGPALKAVTAVEFPSSLPRISELFLSHAAPEDQLTYDKYFGIKIDKTTGDWTLPEKTMKIKQAYSLLQQVPSATAPGTIMGSEEIRTTLINSGDVRNRYLYGLGTAAYESAQQIWVDTVNETIPGTP